MIKRKLEFGELYLVQLDFGAFGEMKNGGSLPPGKYCSILIGLVKENDFAGFYHALIGRHRYIVYITEIKDKIS